MTEQFFRPTARTIRRSAAVLAVFGLVGGATWRGLAADPRSTPPKPDRVVAAPAPAAERSVVADRDSYADIVKRVSPAVVTVRVEGKTKVSATQFEGDEFFRRFFGEPGPSRGPQIPRSFKQRGLGSGVVISGDGYILTNHHVIDGADDIRVDFTDGRTLVAKLVGSDKPSDLALLKVTASDLRPLPLGNSDVVQVGDVVLAVGNPLGIGQTVTMGIISAKGRATGNGEGYEDFLQTDAPINHGNSGGALVNTKGELVGINSQIMSSTGENIGIGFAIPANMAKHVTDQLRTDGKVRRSRLGVSIQPVTSDMAASLGLKDVSGVVGGVIVSGVEPESAADRAGIKQGDILQSFNGEAVKDLNALRNRVADTTPGSSSTVSLLRDGVKRDVTVKLDEAPSKSARGGNSDGAAPDDKLALGIAAAPVSPETATRFNLPKGVKGVVVQDVNPEGRAAEAGIQVGDVIEQVNREAVTSVEALRAAVRRTTDRPLLVLVNREGHEIFVTVRPVS